MRSRPGRTASGPRLPQALVEQIEQENGHPHRKRNTRPVNRKAARKEERLLAKQRRADFFSGEHTDLKRSRNASDSEQESVPTKKPRPSDRQPPERKTKRPEVAPSRVQDASKLFNQGRSRIEEEEKAYISLLESKLGLKGKGKSKSKYGKAFEDDGLLDLVLSLGSEAEESETELSHDEFSEGEEEEGADGNEELSDEAFGSENEWTGFDVENGGDQQIEETEESGPVAGPSSSPQISEPQNERRYVLPHLRKFDKKPSENDSQIDEKLNRLMKGLLNRLSEQNIDTILKEIEGMYRSHRRHDVTATITNQIIDGTCSHSLLLDSYVALHAAMVACLHKIIGIELAAYFVQQVVSEFERHYNTAKTAVVTSDDDSLGKECTNLLVLISELYNLHVISCVLMYDVIRLILDGRLSELDVELLLKIARASGSQLRQDDPAALKDIIQIVHGKMADQKGAISSRTKFMVETLNNLKNNKVKQQSSSTGESNSRDRLSKFVSGINKKYHVLSHEALRVSLDDLHQADKKGKWWLVGAAWGGNPLVEQRVQEQKIVTSAATQAENALLKLAKKQGMNTDVRRSVFVIIMSSDDYVDACDRLSQLKLTEIQQREIMRVLLHCCGTEKSYNPYYTLIAQRLCQLSHSHKVTLQFCLWDFLRIIGESSVGGPEVAKNLDEDVLEFEQNRMTGHRVTNVAKAFAWWIATDSIAITVLKPLDFLSLKKLTKEFLRQFFVNLFVISQNVSSTPIVDLDVATVKREPEKLREILTKANRLQHLAAGLLHYLSTSFTKGEDKVMSEKLNAFLNWATDFAKDTLRTNLQSDLMLD